MEQLLDSLSVRLNGPKAGGRLIVINLEITDTRERLLLTVENAVLHHFRYKQDANADATLSLTRDTFAKLMLDEGTLDDLIASGKVKARGKTGAVSDLITMLDYFHFWFEIVMP